MSVQITQNLFGPHIDRLQEALGKASSRQGKLVANLANVNTPGFKRQDEDFHISLETAARRGTGENRPSGRNTSLRSDGNNVDLEFEIASIAETELRYQALTDMAAAYFSGLKSVIREGR